MGAVGGGVIGFLIGLVLAGTVAFALGRTLMRVTNTTGAAGLLRFVGAGLLPGTRHDGIAVQRSLAKLLKESYSVMASGRRVAAAAIDIHLSPEDYRLITTSVGTDAAVADLVEFYVAHARDNQWHLVAEPVVTLKRDISLRARQAYAQRTVHPPEPDSDAPETEDLRASDLRAAAERAGLSDLRAAAERAGPSEAAQPEAKAAEPPAGGTEVLPTAAVQPSAAEVTEVLSAGGGAQPDGLTRPYEAATEVLGEAEQDGDLIVVHGTDVRMIPREKGSATIGRSPHSDLVIDRPGVSRDHALVELRPDGWWVVPRDAKNGTLLDGSPLKTATRLPPESTLGLGARVKLKVTVEPMRR